MPFMGSFENEGIHEGGVSFGTSDLRLPRLSDGKGHEEPFRPFASSCLGVASGHVDAEQIAQQRGDLVPRVGRAHRVAIQVYGLELHRRTRLEQSPRYGAFVVLSKSNGRIAAIDALCPIEKLLAFTGRATTICSRANRSGGSLLRRWHYRLGGG
jgi:hypothetical protein